MAIARSSPLFDELLAFRPSEAAQQRADELTEKNKSGELSASERAELEQMLEFDLFVTALKARVAKKIS